jgi:glyoxylase-like metal-dependent hydrolase (beta-lactamase superfamily II)
VDRIDCGSARITRVEEWSGTFLTPAVLFTGFDPEIYRRVRRGIGTEYLHGDDAIEARLQSWVVEVGGAKFLIDTGAGNDKVRPGIPLFGGLKTPFLERLIAAGHPPESFDYVVCTHLHVDHVGWNTRLDGTNWRPTFPRARYVFPRPDVEYWDPRRKDLYPPKVGEEVNLGFFDDSVRPVLEAGLAQVVDAPTELIPGVRLTPAPGHTPGSQVIELDGGSDRALFCGDVVHHPLQVLCPDWNSIFCEDAAGARRSRRGVLERAAASGAWLVPAHFAGRHCVRVRRGAEGFEPVFD